MLTIKFGDHFWGGGGIPVHPLHETLLMIMRIMAACKWNHSATLQFLTVMSFNMHTGKTFLNIPLGHSNPIASCGLSVSVSHMTSSVLCSVVKWHYSKCTCTGFHFARGELCVSRVRASNSYGTNKWNYDVAIKCLICLLHYTVNDTNVHQSRFFFRGNNRGSSHPQKVVLPPPPEVGLN